MRQFQLAIRPRHLRYVFFVNEEYSYAELFKLICSNLRNWGGRYNPIVPVNQNSISDKYISLLKHYDPDYIYYSKGIDIEIIKRLRIFNPKAYIRLDDPPRISYVPGLDSLYLLSRFEKKSQILATEGLNNFPSPLHDFYKINFGFEKYLVNIDIELGKHHQNIPINAENFSSLNKIIHVDKPVNLSGLSRLNVNTKILRSLGGGYDSFLDVVVAKDKSEKLDLIYFWNRLLYERRNTLYLTLKEAQILIQDKFFFGVLHDMTNSENTISVVSMTLNKEEVEDLVAAFNANTFRRKFVYKDVSNFPYEITDHNGLYERNYGEVTTFQTLISENGIIHVPKLSFTDKIDFHSQEWVLDIEIKQAAEQYKNQIQFPYTTDTGYIVRGIEGRVNRNRNISVFMHKQVNATGVLEIKIPEFKDLLRQLIQVPIIDGDYSETKFIEIGLHDPSNKLSAFIKSFNSNLGTIEDYFTDEFWVELFEDLITNERVVGDSITFEKLKEKVITYLQKQNITLGNKNETYRHEINLERGLKRTLAELCFYKVFLKGFNLKCVTCSSEFWYHVKEVSSTVNCRGCFEDFELPIEPRFAYKLNDLIKNNMFQTKQHRDGNLTVIRTLAYLESTSRYSFQYSPQINLYSDIRSNQPYSDIDIVCISDGRLIIGEAKHDSRAFFLEQNKSLKSLVEISKALRPDKIILSCYNNPLAKLENAQKSLNGLFNKWEYQPEIEILELYPPYYHSGEIRFFLE